MLAPRKWVCSSAWLERTPDKGEVGSSSLPRPTISLKFVDLITLLSSIGYIETMKNLFLISIFTIFLVSCGDSKRSAYVSDCLSATPGGSSYKEFCECVYDRGLDLMSTEEKRAYQRDFAEIEDAEYTFTAPLKFFTANAQCLEEVMQEME